MQGFAVIVEKAHDDTGFTLPLPVVDPPPFDPQAISDEVLEHAPLVSVDLAGLIATQPACDPEKLDAMAHEQWDSTGMPVGAQAEDGWRADVPTVVDYAGARYIVDGHHRIAVALMRGDTTIPVAYVRWSESQPDVAKYAPDQERDEHGRFEDEGKGDAKPERMFEDHEIAQQVLAAHAAQTLVGSISDELDSGTGRSIDVGQWPVGDRLAAIAATSERPDLYYRSDRYSDRTVDRQYETFKTEAVAGKWSSDKVLQEALARGLLTTTKEGAFTYHADSGRLANVLDNLSPTQRDQFEKGLVQIQLDHSGGSAGGGAPSYYPRDLILNGWSKDEIERFADRVQAAGGSSATWNSENSTYRTIDAQADHLAMFSKDYESFRSATFQDWAMSGASSTLIKYAAGEAFPGQAGFYTPPDFLERSGIWQGIKDPHDLYSDRALDNLRALKAETEQFYRKSLDKDVTVLRGVGGHPEAYTPAGAESWTVDARTVDRFGNMMGEGNSRSVGGVRYAALQTTVKYRDLLWTHKSAAGKPGWPPDKNLKGKKEFVVLGKSIASVNIERRGGVH